MAQDLLYLQEDVISFHQENHLIVCLNIFPMRVIYVINELRMNYLVRIYLLKHFVIQVIFLSRKFM